MTRRFFVFFACDRDVCSDRHEASGHNFNGGGKGLFTIKCNARGVESTRSSCDIPCGGAVARLGFLLCELSLRLLHRLRKLRNLLCGRRNRSAGRLITHRRSRFLRASEVRMPISFTEGAERQGRRGERPLRHTRVQFAGFSSRLAPLLLEGHLQVLLHANAHLALLGHFLLWRVVTRRRTVRTRARYEQCTSAVWIRLPLRGCPLNSHRACSFFTWRRSVSRSLITSCTSEQSTTNVRRHRCGWWCVQLGDAGRTGGGDRGVAIAHRKRGALNVGPLQLRPDRVKLGLRTEKGEGHIYYGDAQLLPPEPRLERL